MEANIKSGQQQKDVTDISNVQCAGNQTAVNYTRRLTRYVQGIDALNAINKRVNILDYPIIYHSDDASKIFIINKLRDELEEEKVKPYQERDFNRISDLKDSLSKFEPDNKTKYVICSDYLQKIAEDLGIGIGFNNTFPYFYNGYYWKEMRPELMKEFLIMGAERTGFNQYKIRNIDQVEALFKQFAYSSIIPISDQDKDAVKINLKNGTFTIKGENQNLQSFNSEDMFKYQLQFDYDVDAKAPLFREFLNRVLPEKESQMILAEYLGYVLTRNLKLEKCLVLVGSGANGKSVVFDIATALFGKENVSSSTLSQLCNENGYFRVDLTNKLLNYSSELGGKGCNPDTVKQLISNEPIMARSPYKDAFELRDYAKMMFNVNEFPKDVEQTRAYYRRFIFLPFDVTIPDKEQDKNLAKKIIEKELSGIFNWVLEGLNRILQNEQFTLSPKAEAKKTEIKLESDSVSEFMEARGYRPSSENHLSLSELYNDYCNFCMNESGRHKLNRAGFVKRLETFMGYKIKRKATNNDTWVFCKRKGELEDSELDASIPDIMK